MLLMAEKENKTRIFKENASKQRMKIRTLKEVEIENAGLGGTDELLPDIITNLTADNLDNLGVPPPKPVAKKGKGGSKKPAWATTEKQQEEEKEKEIDDLLEFAYELDYEKYMEDFDVRQALEVIKQRVQAMN